MVACIIASPPPTLRGHFHQIQCSLYGFKKHLPLNGFYGALILPIQFHLWTRSPAIIAWILYRLYRCVFFPILLLWIIWGDAIPSTNHTRLRCCRLVLAFLSLFFRNAERAIFKKSSHWAWRYFLKWVGGLAIARHSTLSPSQKCLSILAARGATVGTACQVKPRNDSVRIRRIFLLILIPKFSFGSTF